MYNEASISVLTDRIGFGKGSQKIEISETLQTGTSGRTVSGFHRMATLHNLYETVQDINKPISEFESYLENFRKECVLAVVTQIMDKNKMYRGDFDYSDTIISHPQLFDDAIGFQMAISMIEEMISSNRSNSDERGVKLSYNQLKIELDGIQSDDGRVISKGIRRSLYEAIYAASKVIFPDPLTIHNANAW